MRKIVAPLLCMFFFCSLIAQDEIKNPYDKYGPYGATVYTDLKLALKEVKPVYKIALAYQPVDLKVWPKLSTLKDLQVLHLQSCSVNQWPVDFSNLFNLVY